MNAGLGSLCVSPERRLEMNVVKINTTSYIPIHRCQRGNRLPHVMHELYRAVLKTAFIEGTPKWVIASQAMGNFASTTIKKDFFSSILRFPI